MRDHEIFITIARMKHLKVVSDDPNTPENIRLQNIARDIYRSMDRQLLGYNPDAPLWHVEMPDVYNEIIYPDLLGGGRANKLTD